MKKNSEEFGKDSGIKNLLLQFAVKKENKQVLIGDRAITYNRCSTKKQDSVEWQKKVTSVVVNQNNWQLIKAFGEKESAKTDDRKEFQEMLRFCKKENISHIVFHSYDRFSRAGKLDLIDDLRNEGIKVHSATQYVDDDTAGGRMMQKFYLVIARMENEQRREKIIEGLKQKLRRGELPGKPTIGYEKRYVTGKKEHDHDKRQCFISNKGELIRQAFLWKYNENVSNVEIVARLKSMGLPLMTLHKLSRIFRNPFYCGYITCSLLDDGEIINGKHEALISEEIFLKVNGIVNGKPHGWKMLKQNDDTTLKTSVKCGKCNRPLTAYTQKEKYIYYKCPNSGCCVNITNKELHQLFAEKLSKFSFHPQLLNVIKSQMEATYWMLHSSEVAREKPMKDEFKRLKTELETMEYNLAISKISPELFLKHSSGHIQKIRDIEHELKILACDTSNLELYLNTALKYACNLLNMWQLLDCNGKIRLQKLVYPDGLTYNKEKEELRTTKVNPIFSLINSISTGLKPVKKEEMQQENQELRQLYLMFTSSNFFLENLESIHDQMDEIEDYYPGIWENMVFKQLNPITGATEVVEFMYTSNLTSAYNKHGEMNNNWHSGIPNMNTGTTNNSLFAM